MATKLTGEAIDAALVANAAANVAASPFGEEIAQAVLDSKLMRPLVMAVMLKGVTGTDLRAALLGLFCQAFAAGMVFAGGAVGDAPVATPTVTPGWDDDSVAELMGGIDTGNPVA